MFFTYLRICNCWKIFNSFIDPSFVLTTVGAGEIIYDLRKKIQKIKYDLNQLGELPPGIPEMINTANLLRSNEFLSKTNEKKSELILAYEKYSESLEEMLSSVFEIQKDLKEILKVQSSMIPTKKNTSKSKTAKK